MWKTKKTLQGHKRKVYVLLKILKKMFQTDLTSYILKYSVDQALQNREYAAAEIGDSLDLVLKYDHLHGKFTEPAKPLKDIGVKEIVPHVKEDGEDGIKINV